MDAIPLSAAGAKVMGGMCQDCGRLDMIRSLSVGKKEKHPFLVVEQEAHVFECAVLLVLS